MNVLQNLDLFSAGSAIAAIGVLGFAVFFSNTRSLTNRTFLFYTIVTIFWTTLNYSFYKFSFPNTAIWLLRSVIFFAVWHSYAIFQLIFVFPKEKISFPPFYRYFLLPLVIITSILVLTPFAFSHVDSFASDGKVAKVINGPGVMLFGLVIVGLLLGLGVLLFRKTRKATGIEKKQFQYLSLGAAVTVSLHITFNFVFPSFFDNPRFIPFGAVFTLPFVASAAYAIVRHKLLDVKLISTEVLVFFLAVASLFEVTMSQDFPTLLFRSAMFVLVMAFGILLIRSVRNEIEQREKLQDLTYQLQFANAELQKLDQSKSEFISIASHQLRAPLTVIKGYLSLIREGIVNPVNDQGKEILGKVSFSTEQLIKLVADLLNLSRIESGKIQYEKKEINFAEIVERVAEEFKANAVKKGVSLALEKIPENFPNITADPDKMREVAINLTDNAIKYSNQGGSVVLKLEVLPRAIKFSVKDSGIGIDPEEAPKLFVKFTRSDSARKIDPNGMGIGIYFVKRVVEDHGGKVWFESPGTGKGTTFFVELPLNKK